MSEQENMLVPVEITGGALAANDFDSMTSAGTYNPRLQLFGATSDACKEGKIGIGHYGLVRDKDTIIDLGAELDVAIISWRPKALKINGDEIITVYEPTAELFKKIMAESEVKDSGAMYGPEFLVWIPIQTVFADYFMSSKTGRREAKNMRPLLGKAATLKVKFIKTAKYSWHGPVAVPCSTPFDIPPLEDLQEASFKFQNPPKQVLEPVKQDSGRAR